MSNQNTNGPPSSFPTQNPHWNTNQGYTQEQINAYYQAYAQQQQYYSAYYAQLQAQASSSPSAAPMQQANPYINQYAPYQQQYYAYNPYLPPGSPYGPPIGAPNSSLGKRKGKNQRNGNRNKQQKTKQEDDEDEEAKLRSLKFIKTKEESPEEIAQWIEERRKHFPTKKRVQEKKENEPKKTKKGRERRKDKKSRVRLCSFFQRGRCNKGDQCLYSHQARGPLRPPTNPIREPTLLQKLLAKTMQKEADVLLQCLEHLAQSYLDPEDIQITNTESCSTSSDPETGNRAENNQKQESDIFQKESSASPFPASVPTSEKTEIVQVATVEEEQPLLSN